MSTERNINSDYLILSAGTPVTGLASDLRKRLSGLVLNAIDEDLSVVNAYTVYQSENKSWQIFPKPRVRIVDSDGFEELLVEGTDYSIDYANGTITLVVAITADDSLRADYSFDVFSDDQLDEILTQSAREIKIAIHRTFDVTNIPEDYKEAIMKRGFTNAFKRLMEPTFNFFSVSVMGRDINKTTLVDAIQKIIQENEEILEKEINSLRNFNQTNRFE